VSYMSLDDIKRDIRDIKAIRDYDAVERERDGLRERVTELEAKLRSKDDSIEQASNEKQVLGEELDEARRMIGTLKGDLEVKGEEALEMKSKVGMLEARVLEVEEFRSSAEGKSVRELDKLNKIVDVLRAGHMFASSVLRQVETTPQSELVAKVVEIIQSGVKRGLDEAFNRRVEAKSDSVAQEKLRNLVNIECPNWLRANVDPKVARLERRISEDVFRVLRGPRILRCDRCGTDKLTTLTDVEIEIMMKGCIIRVKCANPQCVNATWFRLKLTLADVIKSELLG